MERITDLFSRCLPASTSSNLANVLRNPNLQRNSRVHPTGGTPQVIRVHRTDGPAAATETEGSNRTSSASNGEVNVHFVNEDGRQQEPVTFQNATSTGQRAMISDQTISDASQDDDSSESGSFAPIKRRKLSSFHGPSHTSTNNNNNHYLTTVFIETGKRKQLRVVHLRSKLDNPGSEQDTCASSGSELDEEDEYWFSKWSQKKRLKKIDKPATQGSEVRNVRFEPQESPLNRFLELTASNPMPVLVEQEPNLTSDAGIETDAVDFDNQDSISEVVPNIKNDPENPALETHNRHVLTYTEGITNLGFQMDDEPESKESPQLSFEPPGTESPNESETAFDNSCLATQEPVQPQSPAQEEPPMLNLVNDLNGIKEIRHCQNNNLGPVKPLLFFIHSISGSSDTWKAQLDYFHNLGYEIVAIDLLGHGLSGTPPQTRLYHFESLVQDVITVFDHFVQDESRQVVLIAHGYGGCLASVLARVRPKSVSILVSIAGGGPTPMVSNYWCSKSWFPCTTFFSRKKKGRFDNPDLKHVIPKYVLDNFIHGQIWLDGDPAFHRRITIPTLLIYGMKDPVVHLVEVCEMERTMPRAYLELIPTAGHMVMWDEPKKLNRMIRKFIQAQWS